MSRVSGVFVPMIGVGVGAEKVAAVTRPTTWRPASPVRWWVSACVSVGLRADHDGGEGFRGMPGPALAVVQAFVVDTARPPEWARARV